MKLHLIFSLVFLISCTNSEIKKELQTTQIELQSARQKIIELESQIEPEGDLVHLVFFKLKPDSDRINFVSEIKKMAEIPGVMDLEIGPFADMGDQRALSEFDMLLQMSFSGAKAYRNYQKHPTHLAIQKNLGSYLAGPPTTYDFKKE